jgi:hypothetical protein
MVATSSVQMGLLPRLRNLRNPPKTIQIANNHRPDNTIFKLPHPARQSIKDYDTNGMRMAHLVILVPAGW